MTLYKYVTSTSKDGNRQFHKVLEIDVDSGVGVRGGGGVYNVCTVPFSEFLALREYRHSTT